MFETLIIRSQMKSDKPVKNIKTFYFIAGSLTFILGDEFKATNFWCSHQKILSDEMRRSTGDQFIDPSGNESLPIFHTESYH